MLAVLTVTLNLTLADRQKTLASNTVAPGPADTDLTAVSNTAADAADAKRQHPARKTVGILRWDAADLGTPVSMPTTRVDLHPHNRTCCLLCHLRTHSRFQLCP